MSQAKLLRKHMDESGAQAFEGMQAQRDHYKALCEELRAELESCADVFHAEGWAHLELKARSVLYKAKEL